MFDPSFTEKNPCASSFLCITIVLDEENSSSPPLARIRSCLVIDEHWLLFDGSAFPVGAPDSLQNSASFALQLPSCIFNPNKNKFSRKIQRLVIVILSDTEVCWKRNTTSG